MSASALSSLFHLSFGNAGAGPPAGNAVRAHAPAPGDRGDPGGDRPGAIAAAHARARGGHGSNLRRAGIRLLDRVAAAHVLVRRGRQGSCSAGRMAMPSRGSRCWARERPLSRCCSWRGRFPLKSLMGTANSHAALVLVLGIAVAVTSIPVISRIFHDLGILNTRFARIVLSVAVFEDVALWAVLAIATALARSVAVSKRTIVLEVAAALAYFGLGIDGVSAADRVAARQPLERDREAHSGRVAGHRPVRICERGGGPACESGVRGFSGGHLGSRRSRRTRTMRCIRCMRWASPSSFPVYFALVGYKLDLGHTFSLRMLAVFLGGACR